jgi:2-polyprenyl-3-methyl-5-hydroxy-6-metoxy-1,4-benzoquinol methylase
VRFGDLVSTWESYGEDDPLCAVLTDPTKKGNRWDSQDFLETGRKQVERFFQLCERTGQSLSGSALDFGCGAGRLSHPLCQRFDRVVGIDVSAPMIAKAQEIQPQGSCAQFAVNPKPDLSLFGDREFDYVQTVLVLQHMHPEYQQNYL